jgi:glutaminyl-tRNA synthetase
LEAAFAEAKPYDRFQFVRQGYFCVDPKLSKDGALVFNRIASLKSSFTLDQTKKE